MRLDSCKLGVFEDTYTELGNLLNINIISIQLELEECRTCTKYVIKHLDNLGKDGTLVVSRDDLYIIQEMRYNESTSRLQIPDRTNDKMH